MNNERCVDAHTGCSCLMESWIQHCPFRAGLLPRDWAWIVLYRSVAEPTTFEHSFWEFLQSAPIFKHIYKVACRKPLLNYYNNIAGFYSFSSKISLFSTPNLTAIFLATHLYQFFPDTMLSFHMWSPLVRIISPWLCCHCNKCGWQYNFGNNIPDSWHKAGRIRNAWI